MERGTSVSHNPVSNMMLGDGVAPVVAMLAPRGERCPWQPIGAASNHCQDLFRNHENCVLLQKVHHQKQGSSILIAVLHMATAGGARALGLLSSCGTIDVGSGRI